ncbi:MAG: hypothetical protein ACKVT2_05845 [Saprospiraceae bacterium]
MKKILFVALAFNMLFSFACSKRDNQVLVRFQNSTNADIKEARMEFDSMNTTNLGLIPADATTGYFVFDYFEAGSYFGGDHLIPMGRLNGEINGEDLAAWSLNWCGTGMEYKQLEPGKYTIEIVKAGSDSPWAYQIMFVE